MSNHSSHLLPFSNFIPFFALQFAVILVMTAWVIAVLKNGGQVWVALTAGGLTVGSFSYGALWLLDHWTYALLFFGVLPVSVLATSMIYVTLRGREIRKRKTVSAGSAMNIQPDAA